MLTTIEELQTRRAALPSPLDVEGTRAQEAVWLQARVLDARISAARSDSCLLAELNAEIEPRLTWRGNLQRWRRQLAEELIASSPLANGRTAEHHRLGLEISLTAIDRGFNFHNQTYPPDLPLFGLMREAGYAPRADQAWNMWSGGFGSLPEVERRLAELIKRRDETQRRLDRTLHENDTALAEG